MPLTETVPVPPSVMVTVDSADEPPPAPHPRKIGWVGAASLAMGGSNQSIFLIAALILSQGGAAIPILIFGLLLSYMAAPGWIELSCMFPNRVGGIAATCAEAFRPYSAVLSNLTGVSYWWGWVPTCGLTAIFSAGAIHQWYLPGVSTTLLAVILVVLFAGLNLCGLKWATRVAIPIATLAALLALGSSLIPIFAGTVNWHQAASWHLISPFHGLFGQLTSAMAGLYLVGFAAPAFEAAACHIGEMKDPNRDQPRAMWVSGGVASIYFVIMPIVWLGVLGTTALGQSVQGDLAMVLGPTYAPLFGALAKSMGIWFIAINMFSGTIQPLSGASRTLSQLSEDGLLPRSIGYRHPKTDAPVVAIVFTAVCAIACLLMNDPIWLVAAANLTYLIGIALPSVAVWLLRRHEPDWPRPYRAKNSSIILGVVAAGVWLASAIFGFEQFEFKAVLLGLALAYSGALAYAWRVHFDRKRSGIKGPKFSLHMKLTGAMLAVLSIDGIGYLIAINHVSTTQPVLIALLKDLFVAVGLLTITVGLILPGVISHTAEQVSDAADKLAVGTLAELSNAMESLAAGNLRDAHASVINTPVVVRSRDEFAHMAESFNVMQGEATRVALSLDVAAEQLRRQRGELERLSVVASSTESFVIIADPDGHIEWVNPSFQKRTGYVLSEVVGRKPGSFLQGPGTDSVAVDELRTGLAEQRSCEGELLNYTKDGSAYWVSYQITPIFDEEGALLQFISVQTDTTDRHLREQEVLDQKVLLEERVLSRTEELSRATAVAEDATRAKGHLLANMSHEIRTPLNAIIGLTHLSLEAGLQPKQHEYAVKTDIAARHLLHLVSDILDFSKIDAGALELDLEPFDLLATLEKVRAVTGTLTEAKNVGFSIECAPDVPRYLIGDAFRLEQVLLNLTSNAKKFTQRGSVKVAVELQELDAQSASLQFRVVDTGIGIASKDLEHIFDEFSQADVTTTRQFGGSGLGLAISKSLVEQMGGHISVESELGVGSSFSFDGRFAITDDSTMPTERNSSTDLAEKWAVLDGVRVLVAEDNPFNQLVVVEILEAVGVRVSVADNGIEVLDQLDRLGAFDVVLMDMQMPDMDGLTAANRIRSNPDFARMAIVALTANTGDEYRAECMRVGMDDFAAKPIDPEELYATVARWTTINRMPDVGTDGATSSE